MSPDRLDAFWAKHHPPPKAKAEHAGGWVAPGQATAYAKAAYDGELARLWATPEGGRNDQLNKSAFSLAQLIASGHLDEALTWASLRDMGLAVGLTSTEVEKTLRSAFQAGEQQPRQVPEREPVPAASVFEPPPPNFEGVGVGSGFIPGGTFILDTQPNPEPLWGRGGDVLLADGEALIIAGGQGLGKTSLGQQLALGRCGFEDYGELLGFPIRPGDRRTLYLAMDRPRQAARSFRRMVGEIWRNQLDDRLTIWQGPPPADLAKHTGLLLDLCRKADADTVLVDSLKDAAIGLTDDETGASYNRARQTAIAGGVQVVELHHNRKAQGPGSVPGIDSIYGSTWLTSGVGSVILLTGSPGDFIVGFRHLKQPADEVGPLRVIHDHATGVSMVYHATDLLVLCQEPMSVMEVARALWETPTPTPNQREAARYRLDKMARQGLLQVFEQGDRGAKRSTRYVAFRTSESTSDEVPG